MNSEPEESIYPPDAQKTLEWIAALSAADFDYSLTNEDGRWVIHVAASDVERARAEIESFERVNVNWPPREIKIRPRRVQYRNWAVVWAVYVILLVFRWLGPYDSSVPLCRAAAANGERILAGEWWRVVTANTMHADVEHLLMNAVFLSILGHAVCRAFGGGLGLFMLLLTGILGNTIEALAQHTRWISFGASTVCFGALGIMTVHQMIDSYLQFRNWRSVWARVWIPFGAGMALMAMTGVGVRSDLAAHAFGFAAGALISLPVSYYGTHWMPRWGQWGLAGLSALVPALAWWMASMAA